MKNFLLFLLAIVSCVFVACSDERDLTDVGETMKVADFNYVGEMHNACMTNIQNNFEVDTEDASALVVEVSKFVQKYVNESKMEEKAFICDQVNKYKVFVNSVNFEKRCYGNSSLTRLSEVPEDFTMEEVFASDKKELADDEIPNLIDLKQIMKKREIFRDDLRIIVVELIDVLTMNYNMLISDAEYIRRVDALCEQFDASSFKFGDGEAALVASVLSIAKYSYNWWQENPDAIDCDGKLPHVLCADLAGAIVSAAINAGGQAAFGGWSWRSFGYSVAMGALTGSTGLVGKIARVFR